MRFDDTSTAFSAARAPGPAARLPAPRSGGQGRFLLRKAGFAALMAVLSACTSDGLELEPSARLDTDRPAPARAASGALEPPPGPAAPPLAEPEPEGAIGPAASSSGYPASHGRARLPAAEPMSAPLQSTAPPSEGVDVDGMLGEPVVRGLAEEEADQIAEGRTSQPVVDGIGGQVHAVAPRLPAPESGPPPAIDPDLPPLPPRAGAARTERRTDARPMARAGEDQVAFVPRLLPKGDAPMSLPPPPQGAMPADEAACRRQLQALGVTYREVPRISNGPACGIDHPVKVSGLSGNIAVSPAVTLNCRTTVAFAAWVKNELAPAARLRYLSGVAVVKPMGGYSCRPMNNRRGNPMSEHAHGNAIDIGTFILKNGKEIDVRKPGFFAFREKGLLKAVRADSCKYFNTVLGPGSDPQHKDHFHFDLRDRRSGYRHCD